MDNEKGKMKKTKESYRKFILSIEDSSLFKIKRFLDVTIGIGIILPSLFFFHFAIDCNQRVSKLKCKAYLDSR